MKLIMALLASMLALSTNAQTFQWAKRIENTLNHVQGWSIKVDNNGNVFSTGAFMGTADFDPGTGVYNLTSSGGWASYLSKLDAAGNFLWAVNISGSPSVVAQSLKLDFLGNIYITGYFHGTPDFDPGPGIFNLTSNGAADIFILKLDSMGSFKWARNLGGTQGDAGKDIFVDFQGNVYTTGSFNGTADFDPGSSTYNLTSLSGTDIFISKLDSAGQFVWAKSIVSTGINEQGMSIATDAFGNVYTAGFYSGIADFDPGPGIFTLTNTGSQNAFISKLNAFGDFVWAKSFGDTLSQTVNSIQIDNSNNLYVTGYFSGTVDFNGSTGTNIATSNGGSDIYVLKLDQYANFIWDITVGSSSFDEVTSMTIDNSNNLYLCGNFSGVADFDPGPGTFMLSGSIGNSFACKLDSSGNFQWAKPISTVFSGQTYALSIAVDQNGDVLTTGIFSGTQDFDPGTGVLNYTTSSGIVNAFISKLSTCGYLFNMNYTACDSIQLNGTTYTNTGYYNQVYSTVSGCDSIYRYALTIPHTILMNYTAMSVCDSVTLAGQTYTASGLYYPVYSSALTGCDSILTVGLTVKHATSNTISLSGCSPFTYNGITYTNSGIYTQTLSNAVGCDSLLTINLSITGNVNSTNLSQLACSSYTLNGQTYTNSGNYTQNYTNMAGCDSTIHLNLTIHLPSSSSLSQSACTSYTLNGITYTNTGVFTQTQTNAQGCDSTITLNLNIHQPSTASLNQSACNSFTLNGQTYTNTGVYAQTITNAAGCDSTLSINLVIHQSTSSSSIQKTCKTYTWNGQTFTASGVYTQIQTNAAGCDSTLTLTLTINSADTSVTKSGNTLTASATGAGYQWISCVPYSIIPGATNQSFTAGWTASYAVIVTQNGCVDTSSCYPVTNVGVEDPFQQLHFRMYPNPVTRDVSILFTSILDEAQLSIIDLQGKVIREQQITHAKEILLDLSSVKTGIYILSIQTGLETARHILVKE